MRTLGFACVLILLCAGAAQARRDTTYAYPYSRVWTAALRMMRIDLSSPITEKDRESGYFLFEYPDAGKTYPGSIEVVRVLEGGVESARVVIQVPGLPSYFEQMMLDRLTRKLGQDYGMPTAPKAPAQPQPEPAKGTKDETITVRPGDKDAKDGDAAPPPPRTGAPK